MPVSFTRLRIAGFKSFAEPVSVEILPGLTGIVGPNGCGKSNVVEALRWAMGENSARSLRGGEMDDVIFAGTAHRASRNLAEVLITLENTQGLALPPFDKEPELQISRKIERGAGSTYRINGKEVRARDVQTLYADMASGARASAMVSQGRVSALVNARPDERRAILEEAAGITGLHARRHEAELKLRATEANLTRAEDLKSQLAVQLEGLKRQARQAARYRNISGMVRQSEADWLGLLHARAQTALNAALQSFQDAHVAAQRAAQEAEDATIRSFEADKALPGPREREAQARGTLERRKVESEGLEQEEQRARAAFDQAQARREQIVGDLASAQEADRDAVAAESALETEWQTLLDAERSLPERSAQAATQAAETAQHVSQAEHLAENAREALATATAELAQIQTRLESAQDRLRRAQERQRGLEDERDSALSQRVDPERIVQTDARIEALEAELQSLHQAGAEAERVRAQAVQAHTNQRSALAEAEAISARHQAALTISDERVRTLAARLDELETELQAIQAARVDTARIAQAQADIDARQAGLDAALQVLNQAEAAQMAASDAQAAARRAVTERDLAQRAAEDALANAQERARRVREQHAALAAEYATAQETRVPQASLDEAKARAETIMAALSSAQMALDAAERTRLAAESARADAERQLNDAARNRAKTEAEARDAQQRLDRLHAQHAEAMAQYNAAQATRVPPEQREAASRAVQQAQAELTQAQQGLDQAETALEEATSAEAISRQTAAEADRALTRLHAEIDALTETLAGALGGDEQGIEAPPVLDQIAVPAGLEAAFGVALGEALESACDPRAQRFWRQLPDWPTPAPSLPSGCVALSTLVQAPPELTRALSQIGVVPEGQDGGEKQGQLSPGQSLVSRDGGAWRWDGHTIRPGSASSGATRLQQRNRLLAAQARLAEAQAETDAAHLAHHAAEQRTAQARATLTSAREARRQMDAPMQAAREEDSRLSAQDARADSQLAALQPQCARLETECAEAQQALQDALVAQAALPALTDLHAAQEAAHTAEAQALVVEQQARAQRTEHETHLRDARAAESELTSRVAEITSRLAALEPQLHRLAQERDGAEHDAQAAIATRDALPVPQLSQEALAQATQAQQQAVTAEAQAREQRRAAEQTLSAARTALASLSAEAERLEQRLAILHPQVTQVRGEHIQSQVQHAQLLQAGEEHADLQVLRQVTLEMAQAEQTAQDAENAAREALRAAEQTLVELKTLRTQLVAEAADIEARLAALEPQLRNVVAERAEIEAECTACEAAHQALPDPEALRAAVEQARESLAQARQDDEAARAIMEDVRGESSRLAARQQTVTAELESWRHRRMAASARVAELRARHSQAEEDHQALADVPDGATERRRRAAAALAEAEQAHAEAARQLREAETAAREAAESRRAAEIGMASSREAYVRAEGMRDQTHAALEAVLVRVVERLGEDAVLSQPAELTDAAEERARRKMERLSREREDMGPVNLRAEIESEEIETRLGTIDKERDELNTAIAKLRGSIGHLNREGRERLTTVFEQVDRHFQTLFARMFGGGRAHLALVGSDDPLLAGLEIYAQPPGKKLATLSLLSGGEQALTALSLIFAVFRCTPAPICVLDEVDAPLDDANVERFCTLISDMVQETGTRFLVVTHHQGTMAHMDRLYGVTMQERGISRLLSVDLTRAAEMAQTNAVAAE